jgi:hypothetical protein
VAAVREVLGRVLGMLRSIGTIRDGRRGGLPWGHTAGAAEDIRVLGTTTTAVEVLAVLLAVAGLAGARAAAPVTRPAGAAPALLLGALIVGGTSTAVLTAPLGHQHGGGQAGQSQQAGHAEGTGHHGETAAPRWSGGGATAGTSGPAPTPAGTSGPAPTPAGTSGPAPAGTRSPAPSEGHTHGPGEGH